MKQSKQKNVAIIGRPNVGKSTLFNRLVGKRIAIETPIAGTTRDRLYGEVTWCNHTFNLMDVAGIEKIAKSQLQKNIDESINLALENSDLIMFVVDWTDKDNNSDKLIARKLRQVQKPVIMVVNKADNLTRQQDIEQFNRFGGFKIIPVSAISGSNSGDLLDSICHELYGEEEKADAPVKNTEDKSIKMAIIGRPNVGKSTLLNTIIGEKRAVVSEVPGTTRDIVEVDFFHKDQKIKLADTAGLRRRGKIVKETPESFSVIRTFRALRECDVAVLLIDAEEGLVANDAHILGQAKEWGKGVVLAVNKLDLVVNEDDYINQTLWLLQGKLNFIPWLPVVFISAKSDKNIKPLLDQVVAAYKNRQTIIPEEDLKEIVKFIREKNSQLANLKSIRQASTEPPVFDIRFQTKRIPHESQLRYVENKIRDAYPMSGSPIFIDIKKRA